MEMNSIEMVNDLILFNWLRYAGDGLKEIEATTEYDALRNMVQNLYSTSFVPVISNYFDYIYNKTISLLPEEINGELIKEYHKAFRNLAYSFNVSLNDSLFNRFTFEESPYCRAVLLNAAGNNFAINADKEVLDGNGNVVDNNGDYRVYIPIDSIKGENETITLPDDAKIINDLTYVLDTHINDYK